MYNARSSARGLTGTKMALIGGLLRLGLYWYSPPSTTASVAAGGPTLLPGSGRGHEMMKYINRNLHIGSVRPPPATNVEA